MVTGGSVTGIVTETGTWEVRMEVNQTVLGVGPGTTDTTVRVDSFAMTDTIVFTVFLGTTTVVRYGGLKRLLNIIADDRCLCQSLLRAKSAATSFSRCRSLDLLLASSRSLSSRRSPYGLYPG